MLKLSKSEKISPMNQSHPNKTIISVDFIQNKSIFKSHRNKLKKLVYKKSKNKTLRILAIVRREIVLCLRLLHY